jgi:hypothetical protein
VKSSQTILLLIRASTGQSIRPVESRSAFKLLRCFLIAASHLFARQRPPQEFERGVSRAIARRSGWLGDQLSSYGRSAHHPQASSQHPPVVHDGTGAAADAAAPEARPPPPPPLPAWWRRPVGALKDWLMEDIAATDRQA